MFFHCQTSLVATFRELYPDSFAFQGNRALVFALADEVPEDALKHCIALALTYHTRPPTRGRASSKPATPRESAARRRR
jgi:hypothetical protein